MFKTEATLGLIASIIAIVAVVLMLIVSLVVGLLLNAGMSAFDEMMEEYADDSSMAEYNAAKASAGGTVALVIIGLILMIGAVVTGFIGTSKLKANNKSGGILLIVAGALSLISLFLGGFWGIISMVLFLVGGIMAATKKDAVAPAM